MDHAKFIHILPPILTKFDYSLKVKGESGGSYSGALTYLLEKQQSLAWHCAIVVALSVRVCA